MLIFNLFVRYFRLLCLLLDDSNENNALQLIAPNFFVTKWLSKSVKMNTQLQCNKFQTTKISYGFFHVMEKLILKSLVKLT